MTNKSELHTPFAASRDIALHIPHGQGNLARESRELVSIGLPVRNGAETLEGVVKSVLAQDHENIELIISDNASTDDTESLCRDLASRDRRLVYHRHATNVGLLNNFIHTMRVAKGTFFRWVGDDDWLAPNYVTRCLEAFSSDRRLVLVTTQLSYVRLDGTIFVPQSSDSTMASGDPMDRFEKLISDLSNGDMPIDPLYGLMRRAAILPIERRNTVREDELFAAKLAVAGPWGHVGETLGGRRTRKQNAAALARYLQIPMWQVHFQTVVQCVELLRFLRTAEITPTQRRRAQFVVGRMFVARHLGTFSWRARKLIKKAFGLSE